MKFYNIRFKTGRNTSIECTVPGEEDDTEQTLVEKAQALGILPNSVNTTNVVAGSKREVEVSDSVKERGMLG